MRTAKAVAILSLAMIVGAASLPSSSWPVPGSQPAGAVLAVGGGGTGDSGDLVITVGEEGTGQRVAGARVTVVEVGISVTTDDGGRAAVRRLAAPDRALGLRPESGDFWAAYTVEVHGRSYYPRRYMGVAVIAGEETRLGATLRPVEAMREGRSTAPPDEVVLPVHALSRRGIEERQAVQRQDAGGVALAPGPAAPGSAWAQAEAAPALVEPAEAVPATIVVHCGYPDVPAPDITVPFEEYVKGVLPSEWIASWSRYPESLLSGALAVRTYAMSVVRTGKYRGRGYPFDITSTVYDQVWNPSLRYGSTDSAVDATAGRYIAYGGFSISAQYRAHTGTPTQYGGEPYLQSIWDQVEADHGYTTTIGPGMSQWGSYWWAELGFNHDWTVKHYYTGVSIQSAAPTLQLSQPSLAFLTTTVGNGGTAETRTVWLADSGGSGLAWSASASSGLGWLSLQPAGGTTPGSLFVTASPQVNGLPLAKGRYEGTVTVSAAGAANPVISLPVVYIVSESVNRVYLPRAFRSAPDS